MFKKAKKCLRAIKNHERNNWANGKVTILTFVVVAFALLVLIAPSDPISDSLVTLPLVGFLFVLFPADYWKIYALLVLGLVWMLGIAILFAWKKIKRLKGCK